MSKNEMKKSIYPQEPTESREEALPVAGEQFFQEDFDSGQFMKEVITPDLKSDEKFRKFLTKELKISNISKKDLREIIDLTDLAFQAKMMGAKEFADFLLLLRETKLSGSSSLGGFERQMETSVINIQKISANEKALHLRDKLLGRR